MAYALLDDEWYGHRKVVELSFPARGLWVTVLAWCAHHRGTRGAVTRSVVAFLAAPLLSREAALSLAGELERAELWEPCPDGWQIHDWQDWSGRRDSAPSLEVAKSDTAPSTPEPDDDLTPRQRAAKRAAATRWGKGCASSPHGAAHTSASPTHAAAHGSASDAQLAPHVSASATHEGGGGEIPSQSDPIQAKTESESARTRIGSASAPHRSAHTAPHAYASHANVPCASHAEAPLTDGAQASLEELRTAGKLLEGVDLEALARQIDTTLTNAAADLGDVAARIPRRQVTLEAVAWGRSWAKEPKRVASVTGAQVEAQVLAKVGWVLGEYRSRKRSLPGEPARRGPSPRPKTFEQLNEIARQEKALAGLSDL